MIIPDGASFKDITGRVYSDGKHIYRVIYNNFLEEFSKIRATRFIEQLIATQELLPEAIVTKQIEDAALVLEHPRIPFISYPYEWCFSALQDAALLHLDIQIKALAEQISLIDASSYNIQFVGSKPIFIDHLSFRLYKEGELWFGHQQFCQQFLYPLLFSAYAHVPFNHWYRGEPDGISAEYLRRILPWYRKIRPKVFMHVSLPAMLQRLAEQEKNFKPSATYLPKQTYLKLLQTYRHWIVNLKPKRFVSTWQHYELNRSYAQKDLNEKKQFVHNFCQQTKPNLLLDIGAHLGEFAEIALANGVQQVVGLDADVEIVEKAYIKARNKRLVFLPLVMNMANPSPGQGLRSLQYKSWADRGQVDAILALAVLHHLVIGNRLPMSVVIKDLVQLAPIGIIEFVDKPDPLVQELLRLRKDIFTDYDSTHFESYLTSHAKIIQKITLSNNHRSLYWYERQ